MTVSKRDPGTRRPPVEEAEAAVYIGMSISYLRAGRLKGVVGYRTPPPPFLKIGHSVRYEPDVLDAWLAARRVDPPHRRKAARGQGATP
jgi:hypothetical protein